MDEIVQVTIPVDAESAEVLADPRNREAAGRLVSRALRRHLGPSPLAQALNEIQDSARAAGLTEAEVDAELEAYNAERRGPSNGG